MEWIVGYLAVRCAAWLGLLLAGGGADGIELFQISRKKRQLPSGARFQICM